MVKVDGIRLIISLIYSVSRVRLRDVLDRRKGLVNKNLFLKVGEAIVKKGLKISVLATYVFRNLLSIYTFLVGTEERFKQVEDLV